MTKILSVLALVAAMCHPLALLADQNIVININGESDARAVRESPNVVEAASFIMSDEPSGNGGGYAYEPIMSRTHGKSGDPNYTYLVLRPGPGGVTGVVSFQGAPFMLIPNFAEGRRMLDEHRGKFIANNGIYTVTVIVKSVQDLGNYCKVQGEYFITKAPRISGANDLDEIKKLGELRDKGYLTQEEFEKKKKEILEGGN